MALGINAREEEEIFVLISTFLVLIWNSLLRMTNYIVKLETICIIR